MVQLGSLAPPILDPPRVLNIAKNKIKKEAAKEVHSIVNMIY
jgi:hypothetical protein